MYSRNNRKGYLFSVRTHRRNMRLYRRQFIFRKFKGRAIEKMWRKIHPKLYKPILLND